MLRTTHPSKPKGFATFPNKGRLRLDLRPNLAFSILRSALSLATFLFDPRGAKRKVIKRETRFFGGDALRFFEKKLGKKLSHVLTGCLCVVFVLTDCLCVDFLLS